MPSPSEVLFLAAAVLAAVGSAGAVLLGLSSWLGRIWATRIADRERARFQRDLEGYRAELSELAAHRQDALTRRRDVYTALATSMRIFLGSGRIAADEQLRGFLRAYDESCVWASEEVAEAISLLLDAIRDNVATPGSVPQKRLQELYGSCIVAMRRDCGFPETKLSYRFISF